MLVGNKIDKVSTGNILSVLSCILPIIFYFVRAKEADNKDTLL